MRKIRNLVVAAILLTVYCQLPADLFAQQNISNSKFQQLVEELPTPNNYRTASGAPGHQYWQQKADYVIKLELDDENQRITGFETINYINNSPDALSYLWLQLDQNVRAKNSDSYKSNTHTIDDDLKLKGLTYFVNHGSFEGGYKIEQVKDKSGLDLKYFINKTMMRIDIPSPLKPDNSYTFSIKWSYNINNHKEIGGRSGYEYFEEDGNYLYEIAQWFPRMAVYDDVNGWQNKQFQGRGEFALSFGDYKVSITVPADHIVAATGELQNAGDVLTKKQIERLKKAGSSDQPVLIITQDEAIQNEKSRSGKKKTWIFHASNVRDFAWASSRKFIWDAMGVNINQPASQSRTKGQGSNKVLAMSFYPKEGNPLWGKYSTRVVANTLKIYSKYSVDYSYPVAISVHGPVWGMEYPMICFNGARPDPDGSYDDAKKNSLISVVTHEVGHNFFPMIINSDERQWTWLDEGLNTFVQGLALKEWDPQFRAKRGGLKDIINYMKGDKSKMVPIMTNSESLLQFGKNAYGKPTAALNILRNTVMGKELFDYAFKEYCRRWAFKRPMPADFFRTMEDASGVDLDWFWRGWFFTTDHVDISIENVALLRLEASLPDSLVEGEGEGEKHHSLNKLSDNSVKDSKTSDIHPEYPEFDIVILEKADHESLYNDLTAEQKELLGTGLNFYEVKFNNIDGLVMLLILQI
ncbi:MAG: M1 family metallopeptidase, partial [Bacteroidetes bacterium]|nr:M1 family metallopeptidase [Bacteroidota bacterium]